MRAIFRRNVFALFFEQKLNSSHAECLLSNLQNLSRHAIETKYGIKNKKSETQQNRIELNQICLSIFQNDEDKIISSYDFQQHSSGGMVIF